MRQIYLDHAATTPLDPRVLEAMQPFLTEQFGNASSVHGAGRKARFAVESSRESVASLLGAEPGEIIFTSGGTESNNAALRGVGGPILTSAAEHESVLRPAENLQREGRTVRFLRPEPAGALSAAAVERGLDELLRGRGVVDGQSGADVRGGARGAVGGAPRTADENPPLVSIMHANNEVGTVSPLEEVIEVCRRRGAYVHCDAVQTAGYGMIRVDQVDVDLMTVSGHKFYGPKGAGVLFVRGTTPFRPLLEGGSQERGRRGGTENVPAIVGFARALELAFADADQRRSHAAAMRDGLLARIREAVGDRVRVVTPVGEASVAPHILHLVVPPVDGRAVDGEMLLLNMDMEGVQVSAGSACSSGAVEPSHVLTALGMEPETASAAIRFSVGKDTTADEVDEAAEALDRVLRRMVRAAAAP